jgi:GrpB-like predicted nucleotidyltransferase (UPF0157 family)
VRVQAAAQALAAAGLGLDYEELRIERTREEWLAGGVALRDGVAEALAGAATGVEVIGSSSVLSLLAKPIIDLAVGLAPSQSVPRVTARLVADGWVHRGDAGESGGHVFVLETRPWHRVAHLHVVDHDGAQWRNYLRLRDLLRADPVARRQYEAVKLRLVAQHPADRAAYTAGKTETVRALLNNVD